MKPIITEENHYEVQEKSKLKLSLQTDFSPRADVSALWDSLESDTESLVQEKAYQRQLQMRIDHNSDLINENTNQISVKTDSEESEYRDEQLDVYDSLQDMRTGLAQTPQIITGRHEDLRQTATEDEYADLRYDPNWRQNLEGAQFLHQLKARLSLDSFEGSEDSLGPLEDVAISGRQEYIVVKNPPPLDAPQSQPPSSPFHLHPQQETSGQEDSLDHSESKSSCMSSECTPRSDRENVNFGVYDEERQEKERYVPSQRRRSQQTSDLRSVKTRDDIVERNKATLGINTHKQGSYLRKHQQKEDKLEESNQPVQTSCETISTSRPESQDNGRDPELMWLRKTQKLKQTHKERKEPKRRVRPNKHSDQLKPQALEANPRPGAHLKPLTERRIISADHQSQAASDDHMTPDAPLAYSYTHDPPLHLQSGHPSLSNTAPTVNLNINLHTPANHSQALTRPQQERIFTLVSPALQWNRPDLYPFHSPLPPKTVGQMDLPHQAVDSKVGHGYYIIDGTTARGIRQMHDGKPPHNAFENTSYKNHNRVQETQKRIPVLQLPTSLHGDVRHYPQAVVRMDEQSVGSSALPTQSIGSYTVLPPIGRANGSDTELCSDRFEQQLNPIHRSSSEGYLSQMERHRQLKAKSNYKVYTLKDYRNLKQEVNLGGLGPTNTIPENVAEKIRRQKLYSNVIREQNKKINRIPFLPARDLVGTDKKETVPRRKALEYAKTISKPKPPPKSKDSPMEKNVSVQAQYLQEMDPTQLATLEMLRKRHEEEKQAVARFKTIHAI